MKKVDIVIQSGFFMLLTFLLVFLETKWIIAALLAIIVHETGHVAAMMILKIRIKSITFCSTGVSIAYTGEYTPYLHDIFAAIAGPLANIFVAFICCQIYKNTGGEFSGVFMAFNICLAIFNLLPIKYLDGGKVMYSLSAVFTDPIFAEKTLQVFSDIFALLILFFGIYLFYTTGFNVTLLLTSLWLLYVVNKHEMV